MVIIQYHGTATMCKALKEDRQPIIYKSLHSLEVVCQDQKEFNHLIRSEEHF